MRGSSTRSGMRGSYDSNRKIGIGKSLALAPQYLLLFAIATVAEGDNVALECELYLAPSTIPNAGLGIFVGSKGKKSGDIVGNGDLAIPVVNYYENNRFDERGRRQHVFNMLSDYVWLGEIMGMGFETDTNDVDAYWPGLDCAVNCNIPLDNVKKAYPSYDLLGLHPSRDYCAGAITPYRNGPTKLKRYVPPGGELFKHYGDSWFKTRQSMFGNVPLTKDYPTANRLLRRLEAVSASNNEREPLFELIKDINKAWNSRTLNAIPRRMNDTNLAISKGISEICQRQATRSIEWLRRNGKCLDHVIPQPSTIKGVGEGAFAKRDLPKGTVITSSPLVHYPDTKTMNIHDKLDGSIKRDVITQQLLVNYCLGHRNTTLLLCPYGSGINYLNHHRDLANVRMQWAQDGETSHNTSWFKLRPNEMEWQRRPSLAIDYIATKDIAEGEELFLDYGDDWIAEWNRYVQNWTPSTLPLPSDVNSTELFIKTNIERNETGFEYPKSVQIRCHFELSNPEWENTMDDSVVDWSRIDDNAHHKHRRWYGHACDILKRDDSRNTYTVKLIADSLSYFYDKVEKYGETDLRYDVPREAIFFATGKNQSHVFARDVFRHPIGLPDEMLPEAWNNETNEKPDRSQNTTETESSSKDEL